MFDLTKIDMVLFDFDDTLCIHSKRGTWMAADYIEAVTHTLSNEMPYKASQMNAQLCKFMEYCRSMQIDMGLLSHVGSTAESQQKVDWIARCYGVQLKDYSVSTRDKKVLMLQSIANVRGVPNARILLVDDMCLTLDEASDAGFQTASPMEIVNFVNDMDYRVEDALVVHGVA